VNLAGKVAVITGGSGGIGGETAKLFAEAGASVVVGYNRNEAKAAALRDSLVHGPHLIQRIRYEEPETIGQSLEAVETKFGRADYLINSGGFTKPIAHSDLNALTDEIFDAIMVANARGPFSMVRAYAPLLKRSGDAAVINISSISGFTGSGSNIAYCAAKAALDIMTLSLARVLGPEIRVINVSPAAVETDFVEGRGRAQLEKVAERTPLKRVVGPGDIAKAVIACVTHLTVATGSRIVVDGGRFLAV
jgi:3-oxoacyl-[acyl-carrier protein] reductase